MAGPQAETGSRDGFYRYALAHFGKSLLWVAADALTILVLIRHAGLSATSAGVFFLVGLIGNAAADLFAGRWMDWRLRAGSSLVPILVIAAVGSGLFFLAGLVLAPFIPLLWVAFLCLLFRLGFSLFDVPHNAMMTRLAADAEAQTELGKLRTIAHGLAAVIVGFAAVPLVVPAIGSSLNTVAVLVALTLAAVVSMLPFLPLVSRLERMPEPLENPVSAGELTAQPTGFVTLCLAAVVGTAGLGLVGKSVPHMDLTGAGVVAASMPVLMAGRFVAAWCGGPLVSALGSTRALALSYLVAVPVCLVGLPLLDYGGPLLLAWVFSLGVGLTLPVILTWVELAVVVRIVPNGWVQANTLFGLFTMVSKLATGAGGLALGLALGTAGSGGLSAATLTNLSAIAICTGAALGALVTACLIMLAARRH